MSAKEIVQEFYKSDVMLDDALVSKLLHHDVVLEWHSSKGFLKLHHDEIIALSTELSKAYVRSKIRISHILQEKNQVSLRYAHFVKTIENPREEMLMGNFFVIWEIKDDKLFKGFQMSQFS